MIFSPQKKKKSSTFDAQNLEAKLQQDREGEGEYPYQNDLNLDTRLSNRNESIWFFFFPFDGCQFKDID